MELKQAKAQGVWHFFKAICDIPHPSDYEQKLVQWLIDYAGANNYKYCQDKAGNLVLKIPAKAGCENWPTVILQGHLDMVCEKTPGSTHNFMQDPIRMVEKDGWIYGDDTTLGADNGIGCALALALTKEANIVHGPLELLFTVCEETGLGGADRLDASMLSGKYLINLDSENDNEFIIGCAGGQQSKIELPLRCTSADSGWQSYRLVVGGCTGGHSGINIHCQRANAINILARSIQKIMRYDIGVVSLKGGSAHNAIPRDAEAVLCFDPAGLAEIQAELMNFREVLKSQFSQSDANMTIELEAVVQTTSRIMTDESLQATIDFLMALPYGVFRFDSEIAGLPETSSNLATVATDMQNALLAISTSQRSSLESSLDEITARIHSIARLGGAQCHNYTRYAAWQPDFDSKLVARAKGLYHSLYNVEPRIVIIHAGLECGVIGKKMPGLEMISMGPDIENPHSPQERVNIVSVDKVWQFLKLLLSELKE